MSAWTKADEVNKKFFNLVTNVLSFYELYRDKSLEGNEKSKSNNVLDKRILVKLDMLVNDVTKNLESYKLLEPVRAMRDFIDDLSTWYLQLSRDRFRDGDEGAKQTLYFVLKTLAKIFAPFAPFFSEDLYQKLKLENDFESVHLESWPKEASRRNRFFEVFRSLRSTRPSKNQFLLDSMEKTRRIVSLGLDSRMKANSKVRQPLSSLSIKKSLAVPEEFLALVKERVNVKSVIINDAIVESVELDTNITEELREEGVVREIIRFVQDLRKKQGLTPSDKISLSISSNESGKKIISNPNWQKMLSDAVQAENINLEENTGGEKLAIENIEFVLRVQK